MRGSITGLSIGALLLGATLGASSASGVVLWDQVTGAVASPNSSLSQIFEPANTNFNSVSMDDFTLSANSTITSVDFSFVYFNGPGPVTNWRVEIFSNTGAALASGTGLTGNVADSGLLPGGQVASPFPLTLTLPVNIPLTAGTYWIAIEGVMPFTPGGEVGIGNRTNVTGSQGWFVNPGGGFAIPGNNGPLGASTGQAGPVDLIFRLNGTVPAPSAAALLGLGGLVVTRRRRQA